ncbi:MAG: Rrf2 family transcriptional regulator [Verrucomicrobiia bacterium]
MKISKKSEYAVRALVDLSTRPTEPGWTQISQIAEATHIPEKYLEQILLALKNGGLLKSKRGIDGGYALKLPPEQITLDAVVTLLEGRPIYEPSDDGRALDAAQVFSQLVAEAEEASYARLAALTLANLLDLVRHRQQARSEAAEYQI